MPKLSIVNTVFPNGKWSFKAGSDIYYESRKDRLRSVYVDDSFTKRGQTFTYAEAESKDE